MAIAPVVSCSVTVMGEAPGADTAVTLDIAQVAPVWTSVVSPTWQPRLLTRVVGEATVIWPMAPPIRELP